MRRRFFPQKTNSKYLTIEALENGSISLRYYTDNKIYYRINKGYWTILLYASEVTIEKGQIIECKSLYENINDYGIGGLNITFECKLSGNCLSLIFGDNAQYQSDISAYPYAFNYFFSDCKIVSVEKDFLPATTLAEYCYDGMFYNCTSLTTAPELSATILARYCYRFMFFGCTSLTTAPELPATTLANNCYYSMFEYCTSLVNAPELHATMLANYCYDSMFRGCTNLNYIKMLATDISATACLQSWVNGVSSTGTFVKNINMTSLPVATSSNVYAGIPSGWTVVNDGEESGGDTPEFTLHLYTKKKQNYSEYHIEPCKETLALVDYFWENAVEGPGEWDLHLPAGSLYIDGWEPDHLVVFKNDPDRADFEVYKNYDGISMPRGQLYVTGEKKGLLEIYDEY